MSLKFTLSYAKLNLKHLSECEHRDQLNFLHGLQGENKIKYYESLTNIKKKGGGHICDR